MSRTHIVAVLALAVACGGLDTPDLSVAAVEGRIVGSAEGAFAYPLGRPDLYVGIGADGRYRFERIPASTAFLVLFDGADRARLVPLPLSGGNRTVLPDEFGARAAVDEGLKMPLASRVYATARVRNGAPVTAARFTLAGTHLADRPTEPAPLDTVAVLWPVPAHSFDVAAVLGGYAPGVAPGVAVPVAQTVEVDVLLDVDLDDDAPGCLSTGCRGALECDDDGFCYECESDEDCGIGGRCDPVVHTCRADPTVAALEVCAACDPATADACGTGNTCVPTGAASGWCTKSCENDVDCPAGLACGEVAGGAKVCLPPLGCAEYLAAFGASCLKDDACDDALKDGECHGRTAGELKPGFCTAACLGDLDCPAAIGFTCSHVEPAGGERFCARATP